MKKNEKHLLIFEKKWKSIFDNLLIDYKKQIKNTKKKFKLELHNTFFRNLTTKYLAVQNDLGNHSRFFIEIIDELNTDKNKIFETEFNKKIISTKGGNKQGFLENLAKCNAFMEMFKFLELEKNKYNSIDNKKLEKVTTNLIWKKDNITEFTQLVYGLFHGEYLTNSKGEITKLVKDVAKVFNITLTKDWQGNLSGSIHNSNIDYKPKIFKKLEEGFDKYKNEKLKKEK